MTLSIVFRYPSRLKTLRINANHRPDIDQPVVRRFLSLSRLTTVLPPLGPFKSLFS